MDMKEVAFGLLSLINALLGWWAHKVWSRLDRVDDRINADNVAWQERHSDLRVHIAETYAKKTEFEALKSWLDERFNDLFHEIKSKADK